MLQALSSKSTQEIEPFVHYLFDQVSSGGRGLNGYEYLTVLNFALKRNIRDTNLLESVAQQVSRGEIYKINTLTNILYVFAKFNFSPQSPNFFEKVVGCLKLQKDELDLKTVSRNMWQFFQLNFYDRELFDIFCQIIVKNDGNFHHKDTANALQSLACFEHFHYDAMGALIKNTIENCQNFSPQSLAIVCNSLADLGVKNDALFAKVNQTLLTTSDSKLRPIDCAQFMTAFARLGFLNEELFIFLENHYNMHMLTTKNAISSETHITMLCAHLKMGSQSLESSIFQKRILQILANRSDLNIKGVFLILSQTYMFQGKSQEISNIMFEIAMKNVFLLKDQGHFLIGQNLGINSNQLSLRAQNNKKKKKDIAEELEIWKAKYFQLARRYAQNEAEIAKLNEKYEENGLYLDKKYLTDVVLDEKLDSQQNL